MNAIARTSVVNQRRNILVKPWEMPGAVRFRQGGLMEKQIDSPFRLYSVEEFLSDPVLVDKGYGSEVFDTINALTNLTVYDQSLSVAHYFQSGAHPGQLACTYQPLVRAINENIEQILVGMEQSDPKKICRSFSWWEKLTCMDTQAETEYLGGVKTIRFHKVLMERNMKMLLQALTALRQIRNDLSNTLPYLQQLIDQGFAFVQQQEQQPTPEYADQLDRFNRQLKNTVAFQSMALMNIQQIAQYIDVAQNTLDRATEISTLLIPIWQSVYHNQNSELEVDKAKIREIATMYERAIDSLKHL